MIEQQNRHAPTASMQYAAATRQPEPRGLGDTNEVHVPSLIGRLRQLHEFNAILRETVSNINEAVWRLTGEKCAQGGQDKPKAVSDNAVAVLAEELEILDDTISWAARIRSALNQAI